MYTTRLTRSVIRAGARRPPVRARFQSTNAGSSSGGSGSPVVAGLAGGGIVLVGGYAYYHFSGMKATMQTAQSAHAYVKETSSRVATTISEGTKNPSATLRKLRDIAHSYVVLIPGAASYVDSTYEEIEGIVREKGGPTGMDMQGAWRVMDVLRRRMGELGELAKKAGESALGPILEKHPEAKDKIGGAYGQLQELAKTRGPEAKKIFDDTTTQIQEIFSKGFSADALKQASELVQSKAQEVSSMGEPAVQDAWKKALETAKPYLDKSPEVRDLLNENAGKFTGAGLAYLQGSGAREMWEKIKDAAGGDKKKQEELKAFVKEKAKEAEEQGSDAAGKGMGSILDWVKALPGGQEMLDKAPNIQALVQISQSRGDDAKKLMEETYNDIFKVLDDKAKKAKDLGQGAAEDAKRKS